MKVKCIKTSFEEKYYRDYSDIIKTIGYICGIIALLWFDISMFIKILKYAKGM